MSKIVEQPKVQLRHRVVPTYTVKTFRLLIDADQATGESFSQYLEFLELVYDTHVLAFQRNPYRKLLTFKHNGRSEAGLRVATWLYGIPYELLS